MKFFKRYLSIVIFFLTVLSFGLLVFRPALATDASLLPQAVQQFFNNSGNPLSSGKVYFYEVGTSTFKDTYTSSAATTTYTNPITLNAGGKPPGSSGIYGIGLYRQLVKDSAGNTVWDAVTAPGGGGSTPTAIGDGNAVGTILPWSSLTAPNQYVFAYGQELARSTYPELYTAITQQLNAICSASSNTLTGISDTTQINIGSPIELSLCVISGTTVVSKTGSTVTLSNPSSVSVSGVATFFPYGNGNGTTTFNVPDLRGYAIAGRDNMGGSAAGRLTATYFNTPGVGAVGGLQTATLSTSNLPAYTPTGTISSSTVVSPNPVVTAFALGAGAGSAVTVQGVNTNPTSATTNSTFSGINQGGTNTAFSNVQPTITLNYIIKVTPDVSISVSNVVTALGGMTGVISCGTGILCSGHTIGISSTAVTPGSYGGTNHATSFTVDATGRLTAAANNTLGVAGGGTGQTTFTASLPIIGNGTGGLAQGTLSGNTTKFATSSGTLTNGNCVSLDSSGNYVAAGGPCTTGGGGGTVAAGLTGQMAVYPSAGSTVVGTSVGTFNPRIQFGAVPNGSTDNSTAIAAAFAASNTFVNGIPTVYFDCDTTQTTCVYNYGGSGISPINPLVATSIVCAPGATLNYTGTAHAVDIGATGLTITQTKPYKIQGCRFTGGATYTAGIYVNNWIIQTAFTDNTFNNFGNQTGYNIVYDRNTWDSNIQGNFWYDDDGFTRNMIDSHSTENADIKFTNNNVECIAANNTPCSIATTGVGLWVATAFIANNVIAFHYPNIRIAAGSPGVQGIGVRVVNNHIEGNTSGTSPCITYGDPGGTATNIAYNNVFFSNFYYCPAANGVPVIGPETPASGQYTLNNSYFDHNIFAVQFGFTGPYIQTNGGSNNQIGYNTDASSAYISQNTSPPITDTGFGATQTKYVAYSYPQQDAITLGGFPAAYDLAGNFLEKGSYVSLEKPLLCPNTTASGTAQVCNTNPSRDSAGNLLTLAAGNTVNYTTNTANTGSLAITLNGTAYTVKKYGGTTNLSGGEIRVNVPTLLSFDGTNLNITNTITSGVRIQQSVTQISHTGDTSETTLATIVVPALPANASLRITPMFSYVGTAGAKTPRIYYGATGSGTSGVKYFELATATASLTQKLSYSIWNRTTSSQFGGVVVASGAGSATTATPTSAITTTGATELTITGQLANAGDTVTLEGYTLEIIMP